MASRVRVTAPVGKRFRVGLVVATAREFCGPCGLRARSVANQLVEAGDAVSPEGGNSARTAATNMVTPVQCAAVVGYSGRRTAQRRVRVWRSPRSSSSKLRSWWDRCAAGGRRRGELRAGGSLTTSRATESSWSKPGQSGTSQQPTGRGIPLRSSRSSERRASGTSFGHEQRANGPATDRCRAVVSCATWSRRLIATLTAVSSDDGKLGDRSERP